MTTERRYFTLSNKIKPVPKAAPRRRGWGRWVLLCAAVLLVLLLLAGVFFPAEANPDRVIRFFRYMGLRDREGYGQISFEGGAGSACACLGDGFLTGNENGLALYGLDGEQLALLQGSLPTPVLRTGGELGFCFSPGSAYAAVVRADGSVLKDTALSGAIIDADLSFDGYSACLTAESGSKAVATVMDPRQEPVFRFSSRTRFLNACAVSERGEYLAAARLEEQDSVFRSGLLILRTDEALTDLERDESSAITVDLGNQVVYELRFLDRSHLMAVAQDEIVFFSVSGERLASVSLRDQRLSDYSVSSEGWVILALEQGSGARVITLDAKGKTLEEMKLTERVRSVSAAGKYAAVLSELDLRTYDRRLKLFDRSWDVLGAARAIARPDGTVLLVSGGGTKLFIP